MNKPLNFSSKTHRIYVVSDLHLGHNPKNWDSPALWATRGFKSIEEHDAWVKDQWFKTMDDSCVILNLGDATFSDPKGEKFRQLTTWPGMQYHVEGNHWSGTKQIYQEDLAAQFPSINPTTHSIYPLKVNNLIFMGDMLHAWIDGISVYAQHYASYLWPELGGGNFAICGHSHSRAVELNPEAITHGKILDCGVDNAISYNGTPFFSWEDIKRIMAKKPVIQRDHH